jgi:hypothetical protein
MTGRPTQRVFYGELLVIDKPTGQPIRVGETPPEFAERQKALLAKTPVWVLHGCYVSDASVTGADPCSFERLLLCLSLPMLHILMQGVPGLPVYPEASKIHAVPKVLY